VSVQQTQSSTVLEHQGEHATSTDRSGLAVTGGPTRPSASGGREPNRRTQGRPGQGGPAQGGPAQGGPAQGGPGQSSPRADQERPASYREVFGVGEFRAVFAADLLSLIGDQVSAVAVAVLLFQHSGSPFLAAVGYATAYLPWLIGGPILAAWAERFPGRSVMVTCDLLRAGLIGLAAIPGMPAGVVAGLVLLAAFHAPPFDAARSALLTHVLTGNRYPVGMSLRHAVHQAAQLGGFALGGALVLLLSAPGVLALNCLTFLVSAAVLRGFLLDRPAPKPRSVPRPARAAVPAPARAAGKEMTGRVPEQRSRPEPTSPDTPAEPQPHRDAPPPTSIWQDLVAGARSVRADARIWFPLLLGIVGAGYAIVPEAIAVAYADELGHGSRAVGLIMAAVAAGSVVGGLAVGRLTTADRAVRLMVPLALVGTLPLLLVAVRPGLPVSLALFTVCGLGQAYQVVANTQFATHVPAQLRTRAFGLAIAGLYGGQSLAILLAGAAAQWLTPSTVIAGSGLLGALGVLLLQLRTTAVGRPVPRHSHGRGLARTGTGRTRGAHRR